MRLPRVILPGGDPAMNARTAMPSVPGRWAVGALAGLVGLQGACAPIRPAPLLALPDKGSLGRVAVVTATYEPTYAFEALQGGKGSAALEGAGGGALACTGILKGGGSGGGGVVGAAVLGVMALATLVCLPVAAAAGAIQGASAAASAEEVDAARASAQRQIAALRLQEAVLEAVLGYGRETGIPLTPLPRSSGPARSDDRPRYAATRETADSIIEISVLGAEAFTDGKSELLVSIRLQARARLVRARDGEVIDAFDVRYAGPPRPVAEWLAAEGQLVRTEFDRGARSVAEQAIDELLLVYRPTVIRKPPEEQPRPELAGVNDRASAPVDLVPAYALRAVEPPIRRRIYFFPPRSTYGYLERFPLTGLQPTFRWEAFPRGFDVTPGDGPGDVREIRYDLRLFGPSGLAYERHDLPRPEHRLEQPLEPCQTYRWTVRARFLLHGFPRATEWTGAYDTIDGRMDPGWWRRRERHSFMTGEVMDLYPIVETPGAGDRGCPGR